MHRVKKYAGSEVRRGGSGGEWVGVSSSIVAKEAGESG